MTNGGPRRELAALVVINEQHNLFPEQKALLDAKFGEEGWEFLLIPAEGWTLEYMKDRVGYLSEWVCGLRTERNAPMFDHSTPPTKEPFCLVFASPIPALMSLWANKMVVTYCPGEDSLMDIYCFHNDNRVSKDVPDGKGGIKKISTVSPTGWQLV